jgi:hypothetical protein
MWEPADLIGGETDSDLAELPKCGSGSCCSADDDGPDIADGPTQLAAIAEALTDAYHAGVDSIATGAHYPLALRSVELLDALGFADVEALADALADADRPDADGKPATYEALALAALKFFGI